MAGAQTSSMVPGLRRLVNFTPLERYKTLQRAFFCVRRDSAEGEGGGAVV